MTITIGELINRLQEYNEEHDDDALIRFTDQFGAEIKFEEFTFETGDPWICLVVSENL